MACPEWFRGRSPALSLSDFRARWAVRGVLCTVLGGEEEGRDEDAPAPPPQLTMHFSLAHPVLAPAGPPAAAAAAQSTAQASPPHAWDPG